MPVLVDHDAAKEIGRVNKLMPFDDTDGRWAARAFVIDTETMVIPALPEAGIDETTWILARWSVRD